MVFYFIGIHSLLSTTDVSSNSLMDFGPTYTELCLLFLVVSFVICIGDSSILISQLH
jgi:hypothetical protein